MNKSKPTRRRLFLQFLQLGCTSFGGPVAHLGYFHEALVRKRGWITEKDYADLVALCQFLPGPASSQVVFAIGHKRGGVIGAFLAWLGFTLPSTLLMLAFALGLAIVGNLQDAAWIHGLKLAAVAVVGHAVGSMFQRLCPDSKRALIAITGAATLLLLPSALLQLGVMLGGGLLGWCLLREPAAPAKTSTAVRSEQGRASWPYLLVFLLLMAIWPVLGIHLGGWVQATEGFYRAGALVFGGGHVILPLLDAITVAPGWVDTNAFLAGYGAAQALPGPLFTFAAFLGATMDAGPGGIIGGLLALFAISLPSWLLVLGVLPYWEKLRALPSAQAALKGTNAAVVGLLIAAFYDPIWTVAVTDARRFAFALIAFALLRFAMVPPWLLVLGCAVAGHMAF